jgi:ribonucleoside-diphosphate reductase alpha chain
MYVTDRFMENYKKGTTYRADFKVKDTGEVIEYIVDPKKIFDTIIDTPEKAFDPALVFVDRFKYYHLFGNSVLTDYMSQNGCNEMVGIDGATCLLATMVAKNYVVNPFTKDAYFDFVSFHRDVMAVIKEMDTILDEGIERNPLEKQRLVAREWRNLGLGITSLGDCMIALGLKYGSEEAVSETEKITMTMKKACIKASVEMGKERGQSETILSMEKEMEKKGLYYIKGLRNCALMAHAPSGTGSTMHGYSTGIEPVFRKEYVRSVTVDGKRGEYENFTVVHPQIQKCIEAKGEIEACIDSTEVKPLDKVKMLEAIQKHTDMCSSNTTNLKKGVTCEEIKNMYVEAWERGVTSMSIYVDGSLDGVLNEVDKEEEIKELVRVEMAAIPEDTMYKPKKIKHGCGELKIMIGFSNKEKRITDVYIIPTKGGGCTKNITGEAILISQVLRLGGNLRDIKKSIKGIDACNSCVLSKAKKREVDGLNCPNILIDTVIGVEDNMFGKKNEVEEFAIKKVEKSETPKFEEGVKELIDEISLITTCPECGEKMNPTGGCYTCDFCGFSHCN